MSDSQVPRSRGRRRLLATIAAHPVMSGVAATVIAAVMINVSILGYRALRTTLDPSSALMSTTVELRPESALPCHAYWIKGEPSRVPTPRIKDAQVGVTDEKHWVEQTKATAVESTEIEVRIQGKSAQAVVLESLRIVVDASTSSTPKNTYYLLMGCGGGYEPRRFRINLDSQHPRANPVAGFDGTRETPAMSFPLLITDDDPETLYLELSASHRDVSWHLEIPWYSGGQQGTLVVRPRNSRVVCARRR